MTNLPFDQLPDEPKSNEIQFMLTGDGGLLAWTEEIPPWIYDHYNNNDEYCPSCGEEWDNCDCEL